MSKNDDLRMKIAEIEDDIACAQGDEDRGDENDFDIDDAYCRLADLKDELTESESE